MGGVASAESTPILPGSGPSIREVTLSQIFRYGREMYRYGNYPEAIQAFKQMLEISCNNELAQYHLMKIARKSPEYKDLETYLNNLPCKVHNFDEEDFLPASLYYETDTELLQEQLVYYNQRYRIAKDSLQKAVTNYGSMTKELEDEVGSLRQQLGTSGGRSAVGPSSQNQPLSPDAYASAGSRVPGLKEQILAEQERHQAELASLRDELDHYSETSSVSAGQDVSPDAARKIEEGRAQLEKKERELEAKGQELSSLQDKFDAIQERLRLIQASVDRQNSQITTLKSEVNSLQR
jgi:tetratricopeptide (TPR) repeat protein